MNQKQVSEGDQVMIAGMGSRWFEVLATTSESELVVKSPDGAQFTV